MRRALVLLAVCSCLAYPAANAQRALAQSVTLPSGVTVARVCKRTAEDGVIVASLDSRPLPPSSGAYFAEVAQRIARRVGVAAADPPRTAVYGALLLRDGSMTRRFPVRQSGDRALDSRIEDALSIAANEAGSAQSAGAIPDSLRVLITFGQHDDGSPFVVSHTRCPAVAFPDNPSAVMPVRASDIAPSVLVRAVVSALGRVDTASARVDESAGDRFAQAAMSALARMRFVPAEFDGVNVAERTEIVVPFAASDSAGTPATR